MAETCKESSFSFLAVVSPYGISECLLCGACGSGWVGCGVWGVCGGVFVGCEGVCGVCDRFCVFGMNVVV